MCFALAHYVIVVLKRQVVYWPQSSDTGRSKRSFEDRKEAFFDPEAEGGTIYTLKPNSVNHAYIVVHNNYGEGPHSPTIDFDMPEGGL